MDSTNLSTLTQVIYFFIEIEGECKVNLALLGNLYENDDGFKYKYNLLLFKPCEHL